MALSPPSHWVLLLDCGGSWTYQGLAVVAQKWFAALFLAPWAQAPATTKDRASFLSTALKRNIF